MAFNISNSIRYNGVETADAVFSKLLIANLQKDSTFKAGVTYSNRYDERGGQIFIRKIGKGTAIVADAMTSGGLDFTHTQTQDSLVTIVKDISITRSEKIYKVIEDLRESGQSVDKMAQVIADWTEAFNVACMGILLDSTKGGTVLADTDALTKSEDLIAAILGAREQINVNGGKANTILISPEMETLLLTEYGQGKGFIQETNEAALRDGKIGRLFGLNVFVSNLIGGGTPLANSVSGNIGNAAATEFIVYDFEAFGMAGDIYTARLAEDDKSFYGSIAQVVGAVGGVVTNKALCYIKATA